MSYRISIALLLLGLLFGTTTSLLSQTPDSLSVQGRLDDSVGAPLDSTVSMTFKLYKDGLEVWSETLPSVVVSEGVFDVVLGSVTPLDTVAFDQPIELGIAVEGDAEMSPRTFLSTSPYAFSLRNLRVRPESSSDGPNLVGGWTGNTVDDLILGATIAGGGDPDHDIVGGASPNSVSADYGTVSGGVGNSAGGSATVGGGDRNTASGGWAFVGGGDRNRAEGLRSTVPGGIENRAAGQVSFAAGHDAKAVHDGTFVWNDLSKTGGSDSLVSTAPNQFLIRAAGGVGIGTNTPGSQLTVNGVIESTTGGVKFPDGTTQTTAASGSAWNLTGNSGTTAGTNFVGTTDSEPLEIKVNGNRTMRFEPGSSTQGPNLVGGWSGNFAALSLEGVTIAGGGDPDHNIVSGPSPNSVSGNYGTISGGLGNTSVGFASTVGGGDGNAASAGWSVVGGGDENRAEGLRSTVPGGAENRASGQVSFAAGHDAKAEHDGTFVWNDLSVTGGNDSLVSTAANQFLIRAAGGVGIGTNAPEEQLHINSGGPSAIFLGGDGVNGPHGIIFDDTTPDAGVQLMWRSAPKRLTIEVNSTGTGTNPADAFYYDRDDGDFGFDGPVHPITDNAHSLGDASHRWTEVFAANATINTSDRRLKKDIEDLSYGVDAVTELRPVRYRWKDRPTDGDRLGLIAQETAEVIPEVVEVPDDPDGHLGMRYSELIPVLIKAVQELQATVEEQGRTIEQQNRVIANQGGLIAEQDDRIEFLEEVYLAGATN